ncbi:hypothetical protein JQC67_18975 [Aurantibacter crassamenti]|uniref:hypothetical protein n=1 Tax=Aurantibacter crassamenti TaxID=1837375 RepID=UPI00193A1305|nr:hypothetical protein [Aurantibacter crassamenti]MBM1108244.1 hypothetical protein [Aurantibacter crassamenti]
MTVIILFFLIIIGLNCIPFVVKTEFPKLETLIKRTLIITSIIFILMVILLSNGYQLKGIYSHSFIELTFIILILFYFSFFKNNKSKLLSLFILVPLISLATLLLVFEQVITEYKINEKYKIEVSKSGFLGCGERVSITKSDLGIFRKRILIRTDLCLIGIDKIETVEFNENGAEFLIYHNGIFDSENPYKFEIKNKNVW